MSQRGKRPNRSEDGPVPVKRRKRTAAEEEEAASLAAGAWQPRSNDMKSIYNRTTTEAPAELFRKDLISAMKLPDSEPLASDEYWVIVDQWKQEWERGVQVPVNPDSLPEPSVTVTHCNSFKIRHDFKLPKNKYIRITKDDNFKFEEHEFSTAPAQAEAACSYDLDQCDVAWLKILNSERASAGLGPIYEDQLERVIERFEECCWDKIQSILRNEEGLGIEYDENVICDVCRSPDSEEGNEMVFCDSCNICVHQACYGITRIPEGQWLCCTCYIGKRPECVLCPNKGGAMKSTRSGHKWAHVSCALWIPEVSIGCVEKMEPITKISSIPTSRWALICVLCRERVGACIQCSVKTCKTAYHVTCAFKHGLEMRAIIEDENADDGVKLRSYCEKHSKSSKKEKSICSSSEDDDCKRKKRKDMTSEEKNQARAIRLQEIESEFFKHVSVKDVSIHLDVDNEALQYIYNYWKLKRKAGNNKPLLPPKSEDVDMLSHKREQADMEKMKNFVQLRQDLERVRNLCYMVSRREKLSRMFFKMREQTFYKQAAVLESSNSLPTTVIQAVIEANHGPCIYDRLYSHNESEDHTTDFDTILARISGLKSPTHSGDEKKSEINGLFKDVKNNPYKKIYFNGSSKRRSGSLYGSMSSASSSDERPKDNKDKENRLQSSSEDEKPTKQSKKKPASPGKRTNTKIVERKKKHMPSKIKLDSSSEDDVKPRKKDWGQFSRSRLSQMDKELGESGSDSDELMPIRSNKKTDNANVKSMSSIYSDSDSSDLSMKNDDKSSNATNDSQNKLRTKAAVKEFSNKPSSSKSPNKSSPENKKKSKVEDSKKDANSKKKDSDLIVPQRQAAKKATENLKSTTVTRVKDQASSQSEDVGKVDEKEKNNKALKPKPKQSKDIKESSSREHKKDSKPQPDIFDIDKEIDKTDNQEILAYVPQRQAAKKAAEHIKSGLGKTLPVAEPPVESDKVKKELDVKSKKEESKMSKPESKRDPEPERPAKLPEHKRKSSSNSSSSSSSSTSSDSSTSSSSDSDEEPTKAQPRSESLFSPSRELTNKRTNAKDWPFLDKGSKPAASSSSSDSSDSSSSSSPRKRSPSPLPKTDSPSRAQENRISTKQSPAKNADKKQLTPTTKREEQSRSRGRGRPSARGRPKTTSNVSDRVGDTNVGSGDLFDSKCVNVERERPKVRKGKHAAGDDLDKSSEKETTESNKLQSPVRKTDKKLRPSEEPEISNLEKEILERKAGKEKSVKSKSTLNSLFTSPEREHDHKEHKKLVEKISDLRVSTEKSHKVEKPVEKRAQSPEKHKSPSKVTKSPEKVSKPLEKETVIPKHENDKNNSLCEKPIKSGLKEIKEQACPKNSKKSPVKTKSIEDIFANKLVNMESKENKSVINQQYSSSLKSEADMIVEDHLKLQKTMEIQKASDINNSLLSTLETEKSLANKLSSQQSTKDTDLDFDIIDEFGYSKDEEIMKGLLPFTCNTALIKGDTKEDSARETLNLVEKLRMGLSKKSTVDNDDSTNTESEKDQPEPVLNENISAEPIQRIPDIQITEQNPTISLEMKIETCHSNKPLTQDINTDFRYLSCSADVPLEVNKNIPIQQDNRTLPDHPVSIQTEDRWVPSANENYPNIQSADPVNYLNDTISHIDPHYLHYTEEHHKNQSALNSLPPQLDVRLQEESLKSQSPSLQDRRISQTPLMDPASMDCMPSPSPYPDIHPQAKWADSAIIPSRRSSSSSAASTSSTCSRRNEQEDEAKLRPDLMLVNHQQMDMTSYMPPQVPCLPNTMENYPTFSEQSQFVSAVSLFPPPNVNTQLPFRSAGPAMFPPQFGAPFPTPQPIPPLPKPEESLPYPSPCTAAFTSSEHNMALTAAMVNMPPTTPKPLEPLEDLVTVSTPSDPVCVESVGIPPIISQTSAISQIIPSQPSSLRSEDPSPVHSNMTPTTNSALPSPSLSLKSSSSAGKKSPSKPTRSSARVTSQMNKSPNKSPGKSPRQEILVKQSGPGRGRTDSKRGSGKSNSTRGNTNQSRGRGRGRGRGRSNHQDIDFLGGSIHNKLQGTVYDLDFEDDTSNDNMTDLKSMRERRKSVDIHDRKYESSFISRHSPQSPKFSSPSQSSHKNRSYNTDLRDLRPPTPIEDNRLKTESSANNITNETPPIFVPPVLPGPVDMRTYNSSFDQQQYNEANLLSAFASGTTETQVHDDIDEDFEKELQSALSSKKPDPPVPEYSSIKVSLSDTRNQLKFKIKGPIANLPSAVPSLPATPTVEPITNVTSNLVTPNAINNTTPSGTSSLRRMRKKELLRQYCNQDMNMDDSTSNTSVSAISSIASRSTIMIPKAITSMTTIPTKDDYRDYRTGAEDIPEPKQHRKESKSRTGGLSRELRQLDLSLDDDAVMERRRSIGSTGSTSNLSASFDSVLVNKRRGRPPRQSAQVTPKLKIKIGNNVLESKIDDKKDRVKPPKKRLATMPMPSVEDLKRESMKFRKLVMADLKCDKVKKKKKDKSEKRKRKKEKSEVQIISNQSENPTKLIIRFGKKSSDGDGEKRTGGTKDSVVSEVTKNDRTEKSGDSVTEAELPGAVAGPSNKETPKNSDKNSPPKVTPIKLKLSRCHEGSGYIMKPTTSQSSSVATVEEAQAVQPGQPPPSPPMSLPDAVPHAPTPLPLNKDCEVR